MNPDKLVAAFGIAGDLTAAAVLERVEEKAATLQAVNDVLNAILDSRERERALVGAAVERLMEAVEKQQADANKRYRTLQASMKAPMRLKVIRDDNGRAIAYDQTALVADGSMTVEEFHRQIAEALGDLEIGNGNGNGNGGEA